MGIIEFHFHDPEFDFSPSMTTGGPEDEADDDSEDEDFESAGWATDTGDESGSSTGLGAVVALVVLVALAVVAGLKRRKGGDAESDSESGDVELEA